MNNLQKEQLEEIIADFLHPEFGSYWSDVHYSGFNPEAPEFGFAYALIEEFLDALSKYFLAVID